MSKTQKIDLNLNSRIINPFRTSRNSSTNPFKYQDFEGNTLDVSAFADVFEGSKTNLSKWKMISSAVMGSITKTYRSVTEPIVNFVKYIGSGLAYMWDYAKNTNVSEFGSYKPIADIMNMDIVDIGKKMGHYVSDTVSEGMSILNTDISDIGKSLSSKFALNCDLTGIGSSLSSKWEELISSISPHTSLKGKSVAELKSMLSEALNNSETVELAKSYKEVA